MGNRMYRKLLYWTGVLGLSGYPVKVILVHPMQVTGEDGKAGVNLVGGRLNENGDIHIYRTRKLKEDDVVHELLHIRFPEDNEIQVKRMTGELIVSRDMIYICSQNTVGSKSADERESKYILPGRGSVLLAHVNLKDNTCLPAGRAEGSKPSEVYQESSVSRERF